jgi:alpha-D-xyloside xylohydrolase
MVRYYGYKPGNYMLYDDEGETFDYEKGDFSFREIKMDRDQHGLFKGAISDPVKNKPNSIGKIQWTLMTKN